MCSQAPKRLGCTSELISFLILYVIPRCHSIKGLESDRE